jgi:hypothetical protein
MSNRDATTIDAGNPVEGYGAPLSPQRGGDGDPVPECPVPAGRARSAGRGKFDSDRLRTRTHETHELGAAIDIARG